MLFGINRRRHLTYTVSTLSQLYDYPFQEMTTTLTLYPPPPSSPHWHDRPHGPDVPQEPYFSHITRSGKDALWVAFVIFTASNLIIAMLAARYERKHRIFHYTNMLITGVAAVSLRGKLMCS